MVKHLIYLAAGSSRRFGGNKLLYPLEGRPLFSYGLETLRRAVELRPECELTVVSRYPQILEAARVDGAGELRTFASVVFPMIKPGIGALAIFTFVNTWNDYFLQLVMLITEEKWTLPLAIANMQGEMSTDYGLIMAGAALASVPIIIVFIAFQKYFTQGIAMGAVKG